MIRRINDFVANPRPSKRVIAVLFVVAIIGLVAFQMTDPGMNQ